MSTYFKAELYKTIESMEYDNDEWSCTGEREDLGLVQTLRATTLGALLDKLKTELTGFDSGQWDIYEGRLEWVGIESPLMVQDGESNAPWTETYIVYLSQVTESPIDPALIPSLKGVK